MSDGPAVGGGAVVPGGKVVTGGALVVGGTVVVGGGTVVVGGGSVLVVAGSEVVAGGCVVEEVRASVVAATVVEDLSTTGRSEDVRSSSRPESAIAPTTTASRRSTRHAAIGIPT